MSISDLKIVTAAKAGAELTLLNPFDGEDTGARFTVLGFDAPSVIAAAREFDRDQAEGGKKLDADEMLRLRKAHLANAALTGWYSFSWEGKDKAYDAKFAAGLLNDPEYSWISEQVCRFGGGRRNFTPKRKSAA